MEGERKHEYGPSREKAADIEYRCALFSSLLNSDHSYKASVLPDSSAVQYIQGH